MPIVPAVTHPPGLVERAQPVLDALEPSSPYTTISVYGPRGMGKTSVLRYVASQAERLGFATPTVLSGALLAGHGAANDTSGEIQPAKSPSLIIVDDAHRANGVRLHHLVETVQRTCAPSSACILAKHLRRGGGRVLASAPASYLHVELPPLTRSATADLIEHASGASPSRDLLDLVGHEAGGNPRSIIDIVDELIEKGQLIVAGGEARLRQSSGNGAEPEPGGAGSWHLLTETERSIAGLVCLGLTNQQVAKRVYLSPHTVNYHLRRIFHKLGITSRVEMVSRLSAGVRAAA